MADYGDDDDALLHELGVEVEAPRGSSRTRVEERVIAGFEEIQAFVDKHGRAPLHGAERDIFERLYAVRLDRLRSLGEFHPLLRPLDHQGLLGRELPRAGEPVDELDDEALLAELGVEASGPAELTDLRHVRPAAERRAAEDIGNRQVCEDFDRFKPVFEQAQAELNGGLRETRRFERKSEIALGRLYILGGQKAYVAAVAEPFTNEQGKLDARLWVVFDNATESNMLMRSFQRALQQDPTGRRIVEPAAGPLFGDVDEAGDEASGLIYVVRSRSERPEIAVHRGVLHKIGVTGGDVARRSRRRGSTRRF